MSPANFDKSGRVEHKVVSLASGDETAVASLKKSVFERYPIRADLLQRVVVWQLAKRRQGTAKSKNRSEVSGSTVKAAPQKGRGKARVGSRRAPQFRHGGRAFPKRPRSFDFTLPHQVRKLGFVNALSAKFQAGKLTIIRDEEEVSGKEPVKSKSRCEAMI